MTLLLICFHLNQTFFVAYEYWNNVKRFNRERAFFLTWRSLMSRGKIGETYEELCFLHINIFAASMVYYKHWTSRENGHQSPFLEVCSIFWITQGTKAWTDNKADLYELVLPSSIYVSYISYVAVTYTSWKSHLLSVLREAELYHQFFSNLNDNENEWKWSNTKPVRKSLMNKSITLFDSLSSA